MIAQSLLLQAANPQLPPAGGGVFVLFTLVKMVVVFTVYMIGVALLTLAERKSQRGFRIASVQIALGPAVLGSRSRTVSRIS